MRHLRGQACARRPRANAAVPTATGSLVRTIAAFRGDGRTLVPLKVEEPNAVEAAIAEREALDPESAGEYFETNKSRGLLQRLRFWKR